MFNEILTGKASLEPPPPPGGGPYREPEVPQETRSCARCRQAFVVSATSHAQTCVTCQLAAAQASAPHVSYESVRPRGDNPVPYLRIAIAVMVALGGLAYSHFDGDAARVREARNLADEGCSCTTTECANAVTEKFLAWAHEHGEERVDDSDYRAVEDSARQLGECAARIEAQALPSSISE